MKFWIAMKSRIAMLWRLQNPWAVAVLLVTVLLRSGAARANADAKSDGPGDATYHSTVAEVRVTFFATDENSRPVESVTASDFAVIDSERVIRKFRSFTHSEEISLEVVALVDRSESTAPRFQIAVSDVKQLVDGERSMSDDSVSVLWFGGLKAAVLCSNGCRDSDVASELLAVPTDSTTPLFDALTFAADFITQHRRAGVRPVVVLFSDGDDNISIHSGREAMEALLGAGALVYAVDMGAVGNDNGSSKETAGNETTGSGLLLQLAEGTGGRYFAGAWSARTSARRPSSGQSSFRQSLFKQSVSGQSSFPEATTSDGAGLLNAALNDLRASYVVTYDLPSHEGGFHSLRLLPTHNLNLTFHSRNGYNYEPAAP